LKSKLDFFDYIRKYQIISIIGMAKNVGKTTTLNHIIKLAHGQYTLGLTSIGRDGEVVDILSCKEKPDIYVPKGSIIATAHDCLKSCDITKEIVYSTGINTPIGEVILLKALSDGFVELGGPSIGSQIKCLTQKLKSLGSDLILIDGAFDRKSFASPSISEATILVTGAALSKDIEQVVKETKFTVELLSISQIEDPKLKGILDQLRKARLCIIDINYKHKIIDVLTTLDAAKQIAENLDNNTKYVYIDGVITDKLLNDLMKITDQYKNKIFLVKDGTKLFLEEKTYKKFINKGGLIRSLSSINIICIIGNPYSLNDDYMFDKTKFLSLLQEKINLPIFDLGPSE
jgi:hypothetical protein